MPPRSDITKRDHQTVADFIADEFRRRCKASRRAELAKQWKEVDRQIAMEPKAAIQRSGDPAENWLPQIEMPALAQALEILLADSTRLVFPVSTDWYTAFAKMDDDFLRGETPPMIVEQDLPNEPQIEPEQLVNLVVHSTLDRLHKLTGWRQTWKCLLNEALKYGTFVGRWAVIEQDKRGGDYRGLGNRKLPTLIPVSIKNHYPDDSWQAVMQEGVSIEPSMIRHWYQKTEDLKRADGPGWIRANLNRLEDGSGSREKRDHTEVVEMEGDVWIPRSQGGFYLRNKRLTVAITGGPSLLRVQDMNTPFRSYLTGYYQRDDIDSPYGTSPLLKGRPLQEIISESANRLMQAAILSTEPPIIYDEQDQQLQAQGGPKIAPQEQWSADNPDAIRAFEVGDPAAMFSILQGIMAQMEGLTQMNEPRRGETLTSHTTAYAADVAASRSILRTEDFVTGVEEGPLTTALYQEYFLLRKMSGTLSVPINSRGMQGFVEARPNTFPEEMEFIVHGSKGVLNKREQRENMVTLTTLVANLVPLLAQLEPEAIPNMGEMIRDLFRHFGVTDAARFERGAQGAPAQPAGAQGLSESAGDAASLVRLAAAGIQ